jgi:hypothetical protein
MAAKPMRTQGLARVYREAGEIEEADELLERADRQALTGLQLGKARREEKQVVDFDTGYAEINKQKFDKPEDRTAAILGLVESTQGVEARLRLENQYSQSELNKLTLQAKKFEDGFSQARTKGVFSAMEWFDEQNASFKLERDPKNPYRVIQVNQDGSRTLFADAKSERELGMIVDAKAKPGGWLELAKFDLDEQKAKAAIAESEAQAAKYRAEASGLGRDVKPLTKQQQLMFDTLKGTDAYKRAVEMGNQTILRDLLTKNGIPPEAVLGGSAAPPGSTGAGDTWAPAAPAAAKPTQAAPTATPARTAPPRGLTREQVGQAVATQQGNVQAEFRVRRDAIAAFEQDPRVRQAYEAVRQLRRSGEAVRANNIENQIAAQRERFIQQRVGGE